MVVWLFGCRFLDFLHNHFTFPSKKITRRTYNREPTMNNWLAIRFLVIKPVEMLDEIANLEPAANTNEAHFHGKLKQVIDF